MPCGSGEGTLLPQFPHQQKYKEGNILPSKISMWKVPQEGCSLLLCW